MNGGTNSSSSASWSVLPVLDAPDPGLTGIKRVFPKLLGKFHEIPLFEIDQMTQPGLFRVFPRTGQLEIIVVDPRDPRVGKVGDLARGSTDTAPDVEDFHALFETDLGGKVVLVTSQLRTSA